MAGRRIGRLVDAEFESTVATETHNGRWEALQTESSASGRDEVQNTPDKCCRNAVAKDETGDESVQRLSVRPFLSKLSNT